MSQSKIRIEKPKTINSSQHIRKIIALGAKVGKEEVQIETLCTKIIIKTKINSEELIMLAKKQPEITSFLQKNIITDILISYHDDIGIVEFYSSF